MKNTTIFFPLGAFYPSQIGGPCNTLYWHTTALKNNGIAPTIITTTFGIAAEAKITSNEWLELECGNVYYDTKRVSSRATRRRIAQEISKADIVHLNSLFSTYSIYSFFYRLLFHPKKHIVWSVRGELNENALKYSRWKKNPILFLYKLFNRNILYHSTSAQETKGIKKIFSNSKVVELPNLLAPAKRLEVTYKKNLLYVGRIHPIKSIHKLISSLALSESFLNSDFKLFIVGKHEERHSYYKQELLELVKLLNLQDRVVFKGHLEGLEKERVYVQAYAFILASETENFGNVVVESLNQGTPVIASKGTPWRILEIYNAGYHVSNSPTALAKTIDTIMQLDKEEYHQMQLNTYKLIDENFRVDTQIYKWIDVYKTLLNENKR